MSIVIFVPEHPQDIARYRWAALSSRGEPGPHQAGLAGVPPHADAILIAPANAVRLTTAKLPAKNRRRLTRLAYAIEDGLAEDAALLHAVAGPEAADGKDAGQCAVAVCERQWLADTLAAVQGAGANPVSMRVETCLPPLAASAWTAVWNGSGGFVRNGAASGFGFDAGTATPLALRLAIGEAKFPPQQIVVRPAIGCALPDLAAWSSALGVAVTPGPPWPGLESGWEQSVELLSGEFAPTGRLARLPALLTALRPAGIVLALIVIAQFTLTGIEWWTLHSQKQRLQTQMDQTFRASFPDAKQVIDPVLQMRRSLAALRGASGVADESDFLVLAAKAAPAVQGSRIKLIKYEQGRLEIDAVFATAQAVDQARRMLGSASVNTVTAPASGPIDAHVVLAAGGAP
jgi:type II secretion system protein L